MVFFNFIIYIIYYLWQNYYILFTFSWRFCFLEPPHRLPQLLVLQLFPASRNWTSQETPDSPEYFCAEVNGETSVQQTMVELH